MANLIKIYDETLAKMRTRKKGPSRPGRIKPSMLGTKCDRKLFYSYQDVPKDFEMDIPGHRYCQLGDAVHEMFHEVFVKAGIAVEYKLPSGKIPTKNGKPNPEFPIKEDLLDLPKGYIDEVMIIEGKLWLGEWKTIGTNGFKRLGGKPKPDHMIQGMTYLYVFNKMLAAGEFSHIKELEGFTQAEGIRFMYFVRDTCDKTEFVVTRQDQLFSYIVQRIEAMRQWAKANRLPPKTPDFCKSCEWRSKCAKNQLK